MNACLAVKSGRLKDSFIQHCVRELFVLSVSYDIELEIVHSPGKDMIRADALSRMHKDRRCELWALGDADLCRAHRIRVPDCLFRLVTRL